MTSPESGRHDPALPAAQGRRAFTVGIVGTGSITRSVHLPVLLGIPGVRVTWVADASDARAREAARAFGVEAIPLPPSPDALPVSDVVLLAIPPGARRPYFESFARRGIAVLAEKPLAVSALETRSVVELFPAHRLACGFQRRTYSWVQLLRAVLRGRWFGEPLRMRLAEGARMAATGVDHFHIDDLAASGGGALMTLGCHSLDLALYVTGASAYEILDRDFVFDGPIDRRVRASIRLTGDFGACELEYCVSWLDRQPNTLELEFPAAEIRVGLVPDGSLELHGRGGRRAAASLMPARAGARTPHQAIFSEWDWFLRGLETAEPSDVAAESCVLTARLIDDLYAGCRP